MRQSEKSVVALIRNDAFIIIIALVSFGGVRNSYPLHTYPNAFTLFGIWMKISREVFDLRFSFALRVDADGAAAAIITYYYLHMLTIFGSYPTALHLSDTQHHQQRPTQIS